MVLYIVLGVMVGALAIFLVVASVLDRKKAKKVKVSQAKLLEEQKNSYGEVLIWLKLTIDANEKLLKNFVPSVGKLKMHDVRDRARSSLNELKKTKTYNLFAQNEDYKKEVELVEQMLKTNSNIWSNKLTKEIEEVTKVTSELDKEVYKEFRKEITKKIRGIYT